MNYKLTNITNIWATAIINRLIDGGVRHFCIAPGSRNAPLTLALAEQNAKHYAINSDTIELHTHFDERGLGYYALGISKSTDCPVVVITTSGSAVPNLHPAIVESIQTHIPLIVISADRPPELLSCGANQAIQQSNLFGGNVIHFQQLALPSRSTPLQTVLNDIDACLNQANGIIIGADRGPVHINTPFREPLYGNSQLSDHNDYIDALPAERKNSPPLPQIESYTPPNINWDNRSIIIAGTLNHQESKKVLALSRATGSLILADINSQLRLNKTSNILHYSDLLMENTQALSLLKGTQQVIQFGGRITSKRVNQWLADFQGEYIIIDTHHDKLDPHHKATQYRTDIKQFCDQYSVKPPIETSSTNRQLITLSNHIDRFISSTVQDEFSELSVARKISQLIPENTALFTGNSLAIRLIDMFSSPKSANTIYSNRGASGIDGLLASALGCGVKHTAGMTLLIGDLSLLHDLNSLALAAKISTPFIIVVLNNDGGAIFNLLPVDDVNGVKESFFQCPHGLNFEGVCDMFSITYIQPKNLKHFEADYLSATRHNRCTLIEIVVPNDQATSRIKQLTQQVATITC